MRVAGEAQTASRGSSVSTGDSGQFLEAMSLFTWPATVVSDLVS